MIPSKIIANGIVRATLVIIAMALIVFFIYQIQTVIVYLIVSLVLTLIANPIVEFFKRRLRFSNILAVTSTMIVIILILIGFMMLFIPLMISQGENLSLLNTHEIETNLIQLANKIYMFLESHNINSEYLIRETNLASKFNFEFIPAFLNSIVGTVGSFGMGLASVLFITFFFLKDKLLFITGIKTILPDQHEKKIINSLFKINDLLSRYFIGLLIQLFIVFILYISVLLIFDIENAFIIAFICAVLNIIPYVGPLISSILAAILSMINNLGGDFQTEVMPTTLFVLVGFWIVQLIDNNISQPFIFSKSVNSHPLEIFLVILISGFLFGIMGMIIAVPFYTILKVVGKEFFPDNKIIQIVTKNI